VSGEFSDPNASSSGSVEKRNTASGKNIISLKQY